jgi:hypothetical protein
MLTAEGVGVGDQTDRAAAGLQSHDGLSLCGAGRVTALFCSRGRPRALGLEDWVAERFRPSRRQRLGAGTVRSPSLFADPYRNLVEAYDMGGCRRQTPRG